MKVYWPVGMMLLFAFSCSNYRDKSKDLKIDPVIATSNVVDTNWMNMTDFKLGEFKYCDFLDLKKFNRIQPTIFYSKADSITDEILDKNDRMHISQPYRFGYDNKEREISLNNERLLIRRIILNQDEYNNWYTFRKVLIDYESSEGFYSYTKYLLMVNQPSGLSGKGNTINFIQLIDKENKICYEFFLNADLCSNR
jgi:hypothetical protein